MQGRNCLVIPMFLLIFGPKSSGWLDVVSMTSLVTMGVHFFGFNVRHVPRGVMTRIAALMATFVVLLAYVVVHYLRLWDADSYQILRFGRVLVNFLGAASLVSIYYRWFGEAAGGIVVRHLFHCLVMHAVVMAIMFHSATFRDLIVNQIVQADPDSRTYLAKSTGYRVSGLTDSWDALSGLQSLGLLMLPILLTRQPSISYLYATVAAPLLMFSVAISGRTGFVTAAILMPIALGFADLRKLHRTTLVTAAVGMLGALLVMGPLRQAAIAALEESSLGRTVAMFGFETAKREDVETRIDVTFTGILEQHYFLPPTWQTFWLGTGGSGRDTWDYVSADNGIVLNLHNLGFPCFLLMYGSLLSMAWNGFSLRRINPAFAGVALLAVILILLIDAKVMYVFSRNGFTAMILPVLVAWWEHAFWRERPRDESSVVLRLE